MCRKLAYLVIVVMFMPGISVQAEVVTYNFDDGTLQGWSNLEGATEEVFVVQDNWQVRSPNNMVIEAEFGDRDSDEFVKVLTSPAFWIGATTSVEIWAVGGPGAVDAPTWTNYADLPAVATDTDFMGAALRRMSDGEYLLFSRRTSPGEGSDGYEAIGWDAPTIAAAVAGDSPGEQYVVDIIDTFTAYGASPWWAWIGVDDITLTDVELAPLPASPVGYWKLDETSGAIAEDSSGNGYDGILSADPDPVPVWTTDPGRGNVLEFVPGLDYVDCGPGVGAGQNLTVALWIKPADVELMRPISCFDGDDYSENPGWFLMLRHDDWGEPPQVPPNAWFRMTGTEGEWNSGDLWIDECWAPDEWVHMAFTFDEDTDTLSGYINGQLAGITVVPEGRGVASDTNPLIMGHGGGAEQYEGLMDDVYIYDVVLTDAEILNLVYPIAIPVPNGDFEEMYKPGSDAITADLGDGWTQGLGPNTPMDNGTATYSDGTTGDSVDIPGWIGADPQGWVDNGGSYDRDPNFPNRQGSVARQSDTPDGLYYYLSNGGGWGNPAGGLIVSDAPVATVEGGLIYTLSMLANGGATPVVLELLADGVALTPSSSVDPELSGDWQEFSRTYDAASLDGLLGASLTIRLGVGRGASGGQSHFDAVSLSYAPEPAAPTMEPITIDNPGFEDPVLGEDDYTWGDIPGWTLVGGEATGTEGSGVWNVTSADFDPVVAPEGENVLYTEYVPEGIAKGVAQVLTETFAADTDYTLTVEVGNAWYYYFGGYSVQLLAGGVVIAEDNDTLWPDYYTWATSTVEYTYDPADADLVGQPLEIRLLNLELDKDSPPADEVVGVEFDNVTLSYVTKPAAPVSLIEDFDSLAVGSNMQDVDGWEGWEGDPNAAGRVTDAVAYSGTNSLEIVGNRDDVVPNWPVVDSGDYVLTAMQYVPATTGGAVWFWAYGPGTIVIDCDTGKVYVNDLDSATRVEADLLRDQWVELKIAMYLDINTCDFYYGDVLLGTRECTDSSGVDIWPDGNVDVVYYDDFRFEPAE